MLLSGNPECKTPQNISNYITIYVFIFKDANQTNSLILQNW